MVRGRVQRVGYRRFVLDAAQERGLAGYVRNQPDGSALVFAQGAAEPLEEFLAVIKVPEAPMMVKAFEVSEAKPSSRVKYFRMWSASLAEELQEGFGAMETEFRDYRREFRDYRKGFEEFATRTDSSFKSLETRYGEISGKLTKVMEALEREGARTREQLTRAVDRLSELVAEFVRERRSGVGKV